MNNQENIGSEKEDVKPPIPQVFEDWQMRLIRRRLRAYQQKKGISQRTLTAQIQSYSGFTVGNESVSRFLKGAESDPKSKKRSTKNPRHLRYFCAFLMHPEINHIQAGDLTSPAEQNGYHDISEIITKLAIPLPDKLTFITSNSGCMEYRSKADDITSPDASIFIQTGIEKCFSIRFESVDPSKKRRSERIVCNGYGILLHGNHLLCQITNQYTEESQTLISTNKLITDEQDFSRNLIIQSMQPQEDYQGKPSKTSVMKSIEKNIQIYSITSI